jgi:hypothetical protein
LLRFRNGGVQIAVEAGLLDGQRQALVISR